MTMKPILASLVCALSFAGAALAQVDPNQLLHPEIPRQKPNLQPGPVADLPAEAPLPTVVADFGNRRIVGIAMSRLGRVFVAAAPVAAPPAGAAPADSWLVAELMPDATLQPYPPADPQHPLVLTSVTAIKVDAQERLWILDSSNPDGQGVVRADKQQPLGSTAGVGPKLVCVELSNNTITANATFADPIVPATSMLADFCLLSNDKRSALRGPDGKESGMDPNYPRGDINWAFITDAGGGPEKGGALLAVNLNAGKVRRLLGGYSSLTADPAVVESIHNPALKAAPLNAHAITIDPLNEIIYWQPLGSRTLFSLRTAFIRDTALNNEELAKRVNNLGPTVMTSSLALDAAGTLYLADVENSAVVTRSPEGKLATFARDHALASVEGLVFARDAETKLPALWMPATRAYAAVSDEGYKVWQRLLRPTK
jgi:hypothetical protein